MENLRKQNVETTVYLIESVKPSVAELDKLGFDFIQNVTGIEILSNTSLEK
jgi:hypothetical protein